MLTLTDWTLSEESLLQVASIFSVIFAFCAVGSTVLNGLLVVVTIRSRNLHSASNILIAIQAAGDAAISWCVPLFLYNTYTRTFIPISKCLIYQIVPYIAMNVTSVTILLIGVDRYLFIEHLLWYKQINKKRYISVLASATVIIAVLYTIAAYLTNSDQKALCFIVDTMSGLLKYIWGFWQATLNVAVVVVYTKVRNALKRNVDLLPRDSKRIFTSLYLIMLFYVSGWMVSVIGFAAARFLTYDPCLKQAVQICNGTFVALNLVVPFCVYYTRSEVYQCEIRRFLGLVPKIEPVSSFHITNQS